MNPPNHAYPPRRFHHAVLVIAGVYNLLWGAAVVLAPNLAFTLLDLDPPRYPSIWQCVGMIVGVYGIGYLIAARDPSRHWPIVLVGLLGKIFGPIGFIIAASRAELPWSMGWTILTNDLIWWLPFGAILWAALSDHQRALSPSDPGAPVLSIPEALNGASPIGSTESLAQLSASHPLLLVLLRHSGCSFCREALADLRDARQRIEQSGARIAIAFMGPPETMRPVIESFKLADTYLVHDPDRTLYRALNLQRGSFLQLFGPKVWLRGFVALVSGGHHPGKPDADAFQLPGAFLVRDSKVIAGKPHDTAGDRPDYCQLAAST